MGVPGYTQCYGPESGILKTQQLSKTTDSNQPENLPGSCSLLCLCLGSLCTLSFSPLPPPSQLPLLSCQAAGCFCVCSSDHCLLRCGCHCAHPFYHCHRTHGMPSKVDIQPVRKKKWKNKTKPTKLLGMFLVVWLNS